MNFSERHLLDKPLVLVMIGGLLAATLDIVYACAFWVIQAEVPPSRIFQSVASGLLGESSFEGGNGTAALGFLLHYLIVLAMALAYYLVARRLPPISRRWPLAGAGYGLLLYAVMQYIVVPLSRAGGGPQDHLWVTLSIAAHALLVGIPIAFFGSRAIERPVPART
jgi:uncharacterized membrane protein YagU involved in acid resistance